MRHIHSTERYQMTTGLVYLACPYTHPSIDLRIARFEASAQAAAYLIHQGMFIYSPITMTHPIDVAMATENETMGSDYWCDFDEAFMRVCDEMIILTLPGWRESKGIAREAVFFGNAGKRIRYMSANQSGYLLTDRPQDDVSPYDDKDAHANEVQSIC